jgi:hypothetical protein
LADWNALSYQLRFRGKTYEYLLDFVGGLSDEGRLIAEVGGESEKRKAQALAKAKAAGRLAQLKGGVYWLGTDCLIFWLNLFC